jgi:hypothetical protein
MIDSFVDRDILMRYHWGLAVGHKYSHNSTQSCTGKARSTTSENSDSDGEPNCSESERHVGGHGNAGEQDASSGSESGFEGSQGSDDALDKFENGSEDLEDPAVVLAMDEMYGDSRDLECYDD